MRRIYKGLAAAGLLAGFAAGVLAQTGAPVNTPVGSIWTYFGPTFGAGWAPPTNVTGCTSIVAYGGVADDYTDNTAAWNTAKANTTCIVFGEGTYRFNSSMTYLFTADTKSIRIFGAGSDVTVLHFPNAVSEGINIKLNGFGGSFHVRDFTMTTGTTNLDRAIYVEQTKTWGSVISAGYARSDITGVTLRSDEGYSQQGAGTPATITHSWAYGINTINISMLDIDGVIFAGPTPPGGGYGEAAGTGGVGLVIEGNSTTVTPVEYQITRTHITNCRAGIVVGAYTQGFQMSHLNIVGCYRGIVAPSTSIGDIAQLILTNSHLNNVYSIDAAVSLAALNIGSNHFIIPTSGFAINLNATNRQTLIHGNTFLGVGAEVSPFTGTGIQVAPTTADVVSPVITGNTLWRLGVGIHLGAWVSQATISNNFYANDVNVLNDSESRNTMITGLHYNGVMPNADVTGAVNNGAGLIRVTVPSTTGWVNGMMAIAGGIGGVMLASHITNVVVVDATHLDLTSAVFSGAYTTGGWVAALP